MTRDLVMEAARLSAKLGERIRRGPLWPDPKVRHAFQRATRRTERRMEAYRRMVNRSPALTLYAYGRKP